MPLELTQSDIAVLNKEHGVIFGRGAQVLTDAKKANLAMAMDAELVPGALVTSPNGGFPALFTTWVDPNLIEVLVSPMKMGEAFGEVKKGNWTSSLVQFPVIESVGETSTYGDFNDSGMSGVNVQYPSRQPYHYQTIIRVGEYEQEMAGEARIDWSSRKQISAALTLNKFQNHSYIYGIDGLANYGMINDPSLLPAATGGNWETLTAEGIFNDFGKLFKKLIAQTAGLVDNETTMTCLLSPLMKAQFTKTNQFGLNLGALFKEHYPNLSFVTIPEYSTPTGETIQLIVDEYEGQKTVEMSFTEKMRTHPLIQDMSGFKQKRSQGTLGAILYRPAFVATMDATSTPAP